MRFVVLYVGRHRVAIWISRLLLLSVVGATCLQEAIAGVRVTEQSGQSIEFEYEGLGTSISNGRVIESSATSVLVEVDDLDSLKLEILGGLQVGANDQATSETRSGQILKSPASIPFRGIYRGKKVVLLRFFPENGYGLLRNIKVRLSWQSEGALGLESGRRERVAQRKRQLPIEKQSSGGFESEPLPRVRVPVIENGIYELSERQLKQALGEMVPSWTLREWALSMGGEEVPLEFIQGRPEASADIDSLLFYGVGSDTIYTRTNSFWLELSGEVARIERLNAAPKEALPENKSFPATIHAEENLHIWQTMPRGEGVDHWFWGNKLTAPEQRAFVVETPSPVGQSQRASIRVALHGLTFSSRITPDHKARLSLNGIFLGEHTWDDRFPTLLTQQFSAGLLSPSGNEVTIEAPGVPGVVVDQFFVNWIEIDYQSRYEAQGNRLMFGGPRQGEQSFRIEGFDNVEVDLFEISAPTKIKRLENYLLTPSDSGNDLIFTADVAADSKYIVQSVGDRRPIKQLSLDTTTHWRSREHGADYIIITHKEFEEAARRLADHRESQQLRSVVVQVQDIYDEFYHGKFDPKAIQDFLKFAYHEWKRPAPAYVVLMGDAYLDYLDNLKTGSINYVPSYPINTELLGLTVSDNWFAQVDGEDKIPDLFLGRIPVRFAAEADRVVDRIIRYETETEDKEWVNKVAFIADDDRPEFQGLSEELAMIVPESFDVTRWYAAERKEGSQSGGIVSLFEEGHGLISYTGHGTIASWGLTGSGEILLTGNIANKINPNGRWPVVTTANCLNGFFAARHSRPALAETLLASEAGGAIAVWAPTSLGFPQGHRILMKHFYEQVFERGIRRIGEATTGAQVATFVQDPVWLELMETYVLFGDPALQFAFETSVKPTKLTIRKGMDGSAALVFNTQANLDYTILSSAVLSPETTWTPLPGAPHNSGIHRIELNGAGESKFFKVETNRQNRAKRPIVLLE